MTLIIKAMKKTDRQASQAKSGFIKGHSRRGESREQRAKSREQSLIKHGEWSRERDREKESERKKSRKPK